MPHPVGKPEASLLKTLVNGFLALSPLGPMAKMRKAWKNTWGVKIFCGHEDLFVVAGVRNIMGAEK